MKNKSKFIYDLNKLLNKVYDKKNNIIVFQTDIISSSIKYKLSGDYIANKILFKIEKIFFDKTILFPAFSNDFIDKKYDIKLSKPNTGIIPNLALSSGKYFRSESPLHSFLLKGKKLEEIKKLKQITTWGKGSVFEWQYNNSALWVSLNLNLNRGCAIHHMAEEKAKVPYRFYKLFNGKLYNNGKYQKDIFEKKYSYYKKYSKRLNYDIWPSIMRNKIDYQKIIINKGLFANVSTAKKIVDRSYAFYKKNPYISINSKKIKNLPI